MELGLDGVTNASYTASALKWSLDERPLLGGFSDMVYTWVYYLPFKAFKVEHINMFVSGFYMCFKIWGR